MTKLWFKAKRYGWGWTPSSWEGWVILTAFIVFIIWNSPQASENVSGFILRTILAVLILIWICYKTGEKPRWRWGDKDEQKPL